MVVQSSFSKENSIYIRFHVVKDHQMLYKIREFYDGISAVNTNNYTIAMEWEKKKETWNWGQDFIVVGIEICFTK